LGAHICGQLICQNTIFINDSGPALLANNLTVDNNAYFDQKFAARGHGELGTVRLLGAHIGGQLDMSGANITNDSGPALDADNLTVDNSAVFSDKFTATGHGEEGTVRLSGAHIGGQLQMRDALVTNDSGPALHADTLTVDRSAVFSDKFTATGYGEEGTVRLLGAHIGGQLLCQNAIFINDSGPALLANNLTVDNNAYFNDNFTAAGRGESGTVGLSGTVIKASMRIDAGGIKSWTDQSCRLVVDRLIYHELSGTPWDKWLLLLRSATPYYAAQPYRQLAAITTAAGHDSDTRRILMAQRCDQLARTDLKRHDVLWGKFTGLTLGYGYQPWRALIALLAVTAISAVLMALPVGARGTYVKDHPDQPCSRIDRIVLGVDTALPLVTTPVGNTCVTRSNASGKIITAASLITQLLGWAFATLFVAGFTGAVRKT
jgi:hypothetical protein